eukprot:Sdes_comp19826_c0_seq1m12003
MGKWVEKSHDDMLISKMRTLFDSVCMKIQGESPEEEFNFETFVEVFDEKDKFIRRLFEFLVKETINKRRRFEAATRYNGNHHNVLGSLSSFYSSPYSYPPPQISSTSYSNHTSSRPLLSSNSLSSSENSSPLLNSETSSFYPPPPPSMPESSSLLSTSPPQEDHFLGNSLGSIQFSNLTSSSASAASNRAPSVNTHRTVTIPIETSHSHPSATNPSSESLSFSSPRHPNRLTQLIAVNTFLTSMMRNRSSSTSDSDTLPPSEDHRNQPLPAAASLDPPHPIRNSLLSRSPRNNAYRSYRTYVEVARRALRSSLMHAQRQIDVRDPSFDLESSSLVSQEDLASLDINNSGWTSSTHLIPPYLPNDTDGNGEDLL